MYKLWSILGFDIKKNNNTKLENNEKSNTDIIRFYIFYIC